MQSVNSVVVVGNLTRDPELRTLPSGTSLCQLRIAVNSRRKDQGGNWEDKPNFFDVSVFGNQANSVAQYTTKGRPVAVQGRLDWNEWQAQDGSKRQSVSIIADNVQFLNPSPQQQQPPPQQQYQPPPQQGYPQQPPPQAQPPPVQPQPPQPPAQQPQGPGVGMGQNPDDDIPF